MFIYSAAPNGFWRDICAVTELVGIAGVEPAPKQKNIFLKCSATTNTHTVVNNRQTHHHISIVQRKKQTFCHTIRIKQNAYVQAWLHRKSKATTQETYALFGYNGYTILLLTEQGLVTRLRIALNYTLRGHCVQWYTVPLIE